MSAIPTSITEKQFANYIDPHLNVTQRGYISKIPLYQIFNYIGYRSYTGCQWKELPIKPDAQDPEKNKSVGKRCITLGKSGMLTEA